MSGRHKRRPARSLNRRTGTRRENRKLLVVTEGKTEKEYLEGLMQSLRPDGMQVTAIDVVDGRGEPSKVLKTAKARCHSHANDYDEVWLLLDVDQHAKLTPVLRETRQENFSAAVSNPCFEVWLLWHFEDWTREGSSSEVQQAARRHGLGKSIPPAFPYSKHPEARRRASHAPVGANEIGRNPSTALPSLLEAILQDSPES